MISNVQDIAKYVIYQAARQSKPVSNLKLQKLLYFLWRDYFQKTNKYLFSDEFSAWKFGPVQVNVYFEYYMYGATPINDIDFSRYEAHNIDEDVKDFIDLDIINYLDSSIYDLVNETHKPGLAWSRVFGDGQGSNKRIPFEYIEDDIINGR